MHVHRFELNGYRFTFVNWHDCLDRCVTFDVNQADFSPEWLKAVQQITALQPRIITLMHLEENAEIYVNDFEYDPERRQEVFEELCTTLENWTDNLFPTWRAQFERMKQAFIDAKPKVKVIEPKPSSPGYVYLLKSETGHYKIGRSKNPKSRLKTFGIQLPFRVEYDCLIKSDEYITLEAELHATFADKRIEGEWFALTADDVAYIRELAEVAS